MADEATTEEPKKKKKLAIIIPVIVLVLGLGGGAFMFLGGGKKNAAASGPTTTSTTAPGPIIRLDPITMNLTDGHVLKVGIALEALAKPQDPEMKKVVTALSASGGEGASSSSSSTSSPMDGLEAKALDLAIKDLGNKSFAELSAPQGRVHAQEELQKDIEEAYHGDIVEIYFTTFVMS
jgi:flagellar protein FliL